MLEVSFPEPNAPLTHILVVNNIEASMRFYSEVLGASLSREYGGTSAVYEFLGVLSIPEMAMVAFAMLFSICMYTAFRNQPAAA